MNSVQLIGNLTRDPIMSKGGVAMFRVAVDRQDKDGKCDYPSIKVFGKQAENVCKYLKKGSQCGIEGRIETGSYEKNGETIYYTDVIADRVQFIGGGKKHSEEAEKRDSGSNIEENEDSFEELDEDVPF